MTGPYRVLLVSDAYPPMIGGADTAVEAVATELAARGHSVIVATAGQPGMPECETRKGIEVHRLRDLSSRVPGISENPDRHVPTPWPDPEAVVRFRALLRRFRPDLVHSYGWLTYSCAAALRRTRVPLVLSLHDYGNFCALRTLLYMDRETCTGPAAAKCTRCAVNHYGAAKGVAAVAGVLGGRRGLARRAAAAQFNSEYMRDRAWRHMLAGRTRIRPGSGAEAVVPPFHASDDEPAPDAAIFDRLPDEYILFVGALRRVKGVDDLLEAYGRLSSPPPLVLLGTREIDTPCHFPPGVTVIDAVPRRAVMAAWDRALFGVFPSRLPEPFGLAVDEAMSRGRAVIATVPGGYAERIADGETGLLVPSGDPAQFAAAMQRLAGDRDLRERLGTAARASASKLGPDHWMPRLEALYRSAIETAGGPR